MSQYQKYILLRMIFKNGDIITSSNLLSLASLLHIIIITYDGTTLKEPPKKNIWTFANISCIIHHSLKKKKIQQMWMKFRNDNLFYIKMLVRIIGDFDLIFLSYRLFKSGQILFNFIEL